MSYRSPPKHGQGLLGNLPFTTNTGSTSVIYQHITQIRRIPMVNMPNSSTLEIFSRVSLVYDESWTTLTQRGIGVGWGNVLQEMMYNAYFAYHVKRS